MQELPREDAFQGLPRRPASVRLVAGDGMARVGEVYPELVSATRLGLCCDEGETGEVLAYRVRRDCVPPRSEPPF